MSDDDMLDPREAARFCRVSRSLIYAMKEDIPHYRIPAKKGKRGKVLFRRADLLRWLESCRVEAKTPPAPPPPRVRLRHLDL